MRGYQGEGQDQGKVRGRQVKASVAAALGLLVLSSWVAAAEALPPTPEVPPQAYERSPCATLETRCWTSEDGKPEVRCDRPEFARALLSCVDLWESERLCAEELGRTQELRSIDLEAWHAQIGALEQERSRARTQGVVWLVLGVVGWGVAAGLFVWGATK